MAKLRLNKILAQAGLTSRRGGDRLIVDGHVAVNGAVTRSPATLADPELDAITVDGRRLPPAEAKRYVLLNKPRGYVTTLSDPQGRPVVADLVQRDAEFVLTRAGGNVLVRARIDVGVGTQSNRGAQPLGSSNAIHVLQLRLALDVEAVNASLERKLDLLARFADTGERATRRIATGRYHTIKLAAGNNVETGACVYQQFQDRTIRVRFDRVTNQMIKRRQSRVQPRVVIENCFRAVNVSRRAEFLGNTR